jgi:hypothetical protein
MEGIDWEREKKREKMVWDREGGKREIGEGKRERDEENEKEERKRKRIDG